MCRRSNPQYQVVGWGVLRSSKCLYGKGHASLTSTAAAEWAVPLWALQGLREGWSVLPKISITGLSQQRLCWEPVSEKVRPNGWPVSFPPHAALADAVLFLSCYLWKFRERIHSCKKKIQLVEKWKLSFASHVPFHRLPLMVFIFVFLCMHLQTYLCCYSIKVYTSISTYTF